MTPIRIRSRLARLKSTAPLALALGLASSGFAQSINVDFGPGSAAPSATYGAAGLPGHWNTSLAPHTTPSTSPQPIDEIMRGLDGALTTVRMHQFGGMEILSAADPSVSGDDDLLLNDALITHSVGLESCFYFNGLQNGTYEVLIYGWMPDHPEVKALTRVDFAQQGPALVGGSWTGGHVEGVTYSRHTVVVTNGFLGPHAGLPSGADTVIGGPCNGIQLRLIDEGFTTYCSTQPNSSGLPASMGWSGTNSVTLNDLTLQVSNLPPGAQHTGIFAASPDQASMPLGDGTLCLGSQTLGFIVRIFPSFAADAGGNASTSLDHMNPPLSEALVLPGSTWNYQAWFRDFPPGGAGLNLSNGLSVTYGP